MRAELIRGIALTALIAGGATACDNPFTDDAPETVTVTNAAATATTVVAPTTSEAAPTTTTEAPADECEPGEQIAFTPFEPIDPSLPYIIKVAEHIEPTGDDNFVIFDGDLPPTPDDTNVIRVYQADPITNIAVGHLGYLQGTFWSAKCPSVRAAVNTAVDAALHARSATGNPQEVFGPDGGQVALPQ